MKVLCIPESNSLYLRRLNAALRARGIQVDEAPHPYLRWPGNLARFLAKMARRYDLVHIHWHLFDSLALAKLFFTTRVPKVWTVHNIVPHRRVLLDDLSATHLYLDSVEVAVWHSARTVDEARNRFADVGLRQEWNAANRIIPLMSFNGILPNDVTREGARRFTGMDPEAFLVGHFGPSHPYKGTTRFLEAAARVRDPRVAFCVFGACNDERLEQEIRRRSEGIPRMKLHLQYVPDEELQYWFNACDLIVQPYTEITTSAAVHFAIAFKKPVIASPLGNIPDVLEHRTRGWLASEPGEIVECIMEASQDPARTQLMGQRAYRFVEETANIGQVADAYERAYADASNA